MGINTEERSIQRLVEDVHEKRLLLPELQRPYVWKSTQVRDFFDSLYHQYPSGQLLVWETDDLPYARTLGISGISGSDRRPRILLDGQQRLTSLAAVMLGKPLKVRGRERPIDIVFNVYNEKFEVADATHRLQKSWISLTKLFREGIGTILGDLQLDFKVEEDSLAHQHLQALDDVRKYMYRVNVLEGLYYGEVTDIFVRINSGGTRLNSADLTLAQISSRWRGVTEELEAYQYKIKQLGWELDTTILLRVLAAISTNQSTLSQFFRSGRDTTITVDNLRDAWERAKPAMDQAIYFIIHNCSIDRLSMLPTNYVLVPLTIFFDRHGENVGEEQARDLQRWLYMALIWSRYSNSSETNLDQDISALGKDDPIHRMIQNIEVKVGQDRLVTERELQEQLNNSPYMVMAYVLARRGHAQDWFNGVAIGAGQDLEYHHIFPKALLSSKYDLKAQSRIVNQVANLAFLSGKANARIAAKAPNDYLANIDESRLVAQNVPLDRTLWTLDQFEMFVQERRTVIADAINQLLQSLTNKPALWAVSGTPILKARMTDIEERIRVLIDERLSTSFGLAAWRQGVPGDVKQTVEERIAQRERLHPYEQGQHKSLQTRLGFAHFGDYVRIMQANWELFDDVFGDKKRMEQHFRSAQDARNAFAHNRDISRSELALAEGAILWIEDCLRHTNTMAEDDGEDAQAVGE